MVPGVPIPRLALAGFIGLVLVGGIAAVATVDSASDEPAEVATNGTVPETPAEGTDPSSTTLAAIPTDLAPGTTAVITTAPAGGATITTTAARRGRTTTTTASPGARPVTPGPLVAPKVGDYAYETTTSSGGGRTDRTPIKVEAAGTEGSDTVRAVTVPLALGSQQALTRNTVAFGPSGAVVRRSVITADLLGPQQIDCVWQPPFAQYAGGLAVGTQWSFTTRCVVKVQGFDVTVEQRATRKVTAAVSVAGPAGAVATWTIADDTTIVVTSPFGEQTVRSVGTQQLAPSLGLPVRTEATIEARMGAGAPETTTVTTKLVTLA